MTTLHNRRRLAARTGTHGAPDRRRLGRGAALIALGLLGFALWVWAAWSAWSLLHGSGT